MTLFTSAPTHRILFVFLVVGLILDGSQRSYGQEKKRPDATAEGGTILVQIRRDAFSNSITPGFFGTLGRELQITEVRSWLNRDLLNYTLRPSGGGLYKIGASRKAQVESLSRILRVSYSSSISPETAASMMSALGTVEYAEPIWERELAYTPSDPYVSNNQQWHLAVVHALEAWDIVKADASLIIAITDTGIEPTHADLKDAIWLNPGESGSKKDNGIDDDGNGLIDDWRGYDFSGVTGYTPDNDPTPGLSDHGTHVAGLAGAVGNNGIGGAGVAFGAKLMNLKISTHEEYPRLPGGDAAILYAAAMGADVINCSWGAPRPTRSEEMLIRYVVDELGIVVVAAAGNNGKLEKYYPASFEGVISVTATRENDGRWSGSNYSPRVDLSAPGAEVLSTVFNSGYGDMNGTSMASPIVSGAAGLLRMKDPSLTPYQIREILRATTDNNDFAVGTNYAGLMGTGRLNIARAVETMASIASARLSDYVFHDADGNGSFESGESVTLDLSVRNILAPASSVEIEVRAAEPVSMGVTNGLITLGAMSSGEIRSISGGQISFVIPSNLGPNSIVQLKVFIRTNDRTNVEMISLRVNPTWKTTELNEIASTFNSVGNIGYDGFNSGGGDGFYYGLEGSLLWHAGLLIGTSSTTLADVVRTGPKDDGTAKGFESIEPYRLQRSESGEVEIGRARFHDRSGFLGIEVEMTTYEFLADSNLLLVLYSVENRSGLDLANLYCGLYLDWDLTEDGSTDQALLDEENRMGVMRTSSNEALFIGTSLLSPQPLNFHAVANLEEGVTTDFNREKKWTMLSGGISRATSPANIDASLMISGGPISIPASKKDTFAFGLIGSHNYEALRNSATSARGRFDMVSSVSVTGSVTGADGHLELSPMPADTKSTLVFSGKSGRDYLVELVDRTGGLVREVESGSFDQRQQTMELDLSAIPSGLYFVRLSSEGSVVSRPLIIVH